MSSDVRFEVTVIDGRRWLVCPLGGPSCGRVLADMGRMAEDTMSVHVSGHLLDKQARIVRDCLAG